MRVAREEQTLNGRWLWLGARQGQEVKEGQLIGTRDQTGKVGRQ